MIIALLSWAFIALIAYLLGNLIGAQASVNAICSILIFVGILLQVLLSHNVRSGRRTPLWGAGITGFAILAMVAVDILPSYAAQLATIVGIALAVYIGIRLWLVLDRWLRNHRMVQPTPNNPMPVQPNPSFDQRHFWIWRIVMTILI